MITIDNGTTTTAFESVEDALDAGIALITLAPAIKIDAREKVRSKAETFRRKLAVLSAGKLAEYRVKEEIAGDAANASATELALLSREAVARGTDIDGLIVQIAAKAAVYREIALLIAAIEAEANAGIEAIDDNDPQIIEKIKAALDAALIEANANLDDAVAALEA